MHVISRRLKREYPKTNGDWDASLSSISYPRIPRGKTQFSLAKFLAAATCTFLIACTNVASLLLRRASARQREIATRLALGAGRARIVRQLRTEGLVLSLLALVTSLAAGGLTLHCEEHLPLEQGHHAWVHTLDAVETRFQEHAYGSP
jgi:ABC-type antimicrobial peptide transport system permease subunit